MKAYHNFIVVMTMIDDFNELFLKTKRAAQIHNSTSLTFQGHPRSKVIQNKMKADVCFAKCL